jgi:membrane protein implicated in regulation of membrane protease activity
MQANQLASILAVCCSIGTVFFGALGITANHDFFLLLGNVACAFGNAIFIFALGADNPTWQTYFALLSLFSLYSTYRMYRKYQRYGCDDDEDDEEDDPEAEAMEDERERRRAIADASAAAGVGSGPKNTEGSKSKSGLRRRKVGRS